MIKPKALKKGDTIGVIAPSSPESREKVDAAEKVLRNLGFNVKMGATCYGRYGYLSGSNEERARDINIMFNDKEVDGIICLRGGYGAAKMLHLIDYEVIRKNPKIFVGYSDITAIHTAINNKCKLVTFHGPMVVSDMAEELDKYSRDNFLRMVMEKKPFGLIENPEGVSMKCLVPGKACGKIVGGNLSLLASTTGTPYEINTKDRILFMEDVGEEPYSVDRMLTQLLSAGKLQEAAGIVLGDWNNCDPKKPEESLSLMQVFEDIILPLGKPTIYNLKAGHCTPKATLPFGIKASLYAENCELVIEENTVI